MELEIRLIETKYEHLRVVDRGRRARLLGRLETEGQRRPLLVTESSSRSGWFVLIDGYQRLWALTKLGQETVEVEVLSGSELEGLLLHWSLSLSRPRSGIED
jgi:ParB-like chromosome segregation protein Spo0J